MYRSSAGIGLQSGNNVISGSPGLTVASSQSQSNQQQPLHRVSSASSSSGDGSFVIKAVDSLNSAVAATEQQQQSNMTKRELFFKNAPQETTTNSSTSARTTNSSSSHPSGLMNGVDGKESGREQHYQTMTPSVKGQDGYVGFANLPNQVYRKSVKKGFEFTLMLVGESGLGKSTLINSLFLTDLYSSSEYPGPSNRIKKTVQVETSRVQLKENGVQLSLTVVDTPGFGDAVDNSNCWQPVIDHIETKYEEYLNAESRVNRKTIPDNRVHCCLYFIAPSGHGLKPLDVEFMKRLHDKVNIIPLIAKADTLTPEECQQFKKTIMNEITQHKIKIYEFPDCDDEEENKTNELLRKRTPFAVVGSNTVMESNGKKVRGRKYPWGVVEVESMEHCDFIPLRNMIVRTHMHDLKDVTNNVHYENFRCRKLAAISSTANQQGKVPDKSPFAQMDEEKKEHVQKMKKMEQEMEQVFEQKVREKKQKLKDSEADLQRRHESMKKSLEQQQKELEEKRKAFEKERLMFEQNQEEIKRTSLDNNKEGKKKSKLLHLS